MADPGLPIRPQVGGLPIGTFKLLLEVRVSPKVFIQTFQSFVPQLRREFLVPTACGGLAPNHASRGAAADAFSLLYLFNRALTEGLC